VKDVLPANPHVGGFPALMERVKRAGVLLIAALFLAGCGSEESTSRAVAERDAAAARCPAKALTGWQRLANRTGAAVYCPTWMPDPLDGVIGSRWNNIDEVSREQGRDSGRRKWWPFGRAGR